SYLMGLAVLSFETIALFAIFSSAILSSSAPLGGGYASIEALLLSACCIGAFYFNDLYDYKIVRNFASFLSRVPRSFVAALSTTGLLAYVLFPSGSLSWPGMIKASGAMIVVIMITRGLSYRFMSSRPFVENVLVLGKTPLAQSVIAEMETRPRYRVLDTVDH